MSFTNRAQNTARRRHKLSRPMCEVVARTGDSLLDWGCGRGDDVRIINQLGKKGYNWNASGYDPLQPQFCEYPNGEFDIVTCFYVLNAVEAKERPFIVRDALSFVKKSGLLYIATRTKKEIARESAKLGWAPYQDGFITSKNRGTFQAGLDADDVEAIIDSCGVGPLSVSGFGPNSFTGIIVQK